MALWTPGAWTLAGIFGTLLLLVGAALGAWAIIAAIVYAGSARRAKRYRPGRPYEFTPVWFLAAPERQSIVGNGRHAIEGSSADGQHELTSGPDGSTSGADGQHQQHGETGGASDRW